jgi:hypothetical protein
MDFGSHGGGADYFIISLEPGRIIEDKPESFDIA